MYNLKKREIFMNYNCVKYVATSIALLKFSATLACIQNPDNNRRAVAHQTQHPSARRILPFQRRMRHF